MIKRYTVYSEVPKWAVEKLGAVPCCENKSIEDENGRWVKERDQKEQIDKIVERLKDFKIFDEDNFTRMGESWIDPNEVKQLIQDIKDNNL